jgi:hypothetical protein
MLNKKMLDKEILDKEIVTSARFIAQSAWAKWSQLRLFKAKEGRSYL